jgi:inorganic pyrophosphatase
LFEWENKGELFLEGLFRIYGEDKKVFIVKKDDKTLKIFKLVLKDFFNRALKIILIFFRTLKKTRRKLL